MDCPELSRLWLFHTFSFFFTRAAVTQKYIRKSLLPFAERPPPPQPPLLPALFYVSSRLFSLIGTLLSFVIWPCLCLGERFNGVKWGLIKRSHIRGSWSVLNQSQSGRRRDTDGKIDKMTQRETRARTSREWKCSRKRR